MRGAVLALLLACAVSGCGLGAIQRSALDEFGETTRLYASVVESVASESQDDVDALRERGLGLPTEESDRVFQHEKGRDLYLYMHNEKARRHLELVTGLASSLQAYGAVLTEFAAYGDAGARSKTVVDIAEQMDEALRSPIAQKDADAVGQALSFVAGQVLEAVKKHDIQAIVLAYKPAVEAAALLIRSEFAGAAEGTLFFEYKKALDAFENRMPDLATTSLGRGAGLAAAQSRAAMAADHRFLGDRKAFFAVVQKRGIDASDGLVKANGHLAEALTADTLSEDDVSDFAKQVAALSDGVKSVAKQKGGRG